jgi:hypothetical protein
MTPLDRDELRTLLSEEPDLPADAFTARVLEALPAPRPRDLAERPLAGAGAPRSRAGVLFGFATAACGVTYAVVGSHVLPRTLAASFSGASVTALLTTMALFVTLAVTALSAAQE